MIKLKSVIIGAVGYTPQVITEAMGYLATDEARILVTDDPVVDKYATFLQKYVRNKFKKSVKVTKLGFKDVLTEGEAVDYVNTFCRVASEYIGYQRYSLISGGRKTMSVLSVLAPQICANKVRLAIHITHKDVHTFNANWERAKVYVDKYLDGDISEEEERLLDSSMVPPPEDISIIRLPILPLSKEFISNLKKAVELNNAKYITGDYYDAMVNMGWIRAGNKFNDYDVLRKFFGED